jgi:hypothetical protein
MQHDNFRELFEETADSAAILSDNLIMSYNGKRLFPSVTPNTLKIFGEAELGMSPCTITRYMRVANHLLTNHSGLQQGNIRLPPHASPYLSN